MEDITLDHNIAALLELLFEGRGFLAHAKHPTSDCADVAVADNKRTAKATMPTLG